MTADIKYIIEMYFRIRLYISARRFIMGLFKSQLANVVEWEEYRDDVFSINGITVRLKRAPV